MKKVSEILCHVCIIIGIPVVVFYILDIFNPQMNFLTNKFSLLLVCILALMTIINSIFILYTKYNDNK